MDTLKKEFLDKGDLLYGSFATGEIHQGSDIDMVIVGEFKGKIFERIEKVLKLTDLPIEPLVYSEKEFQQMKEGNPFIKEVIKRGKICYARE
ncbi:MAG: nucleotidyltransferase domain-containing protein [bacterium]